MLIVHISQCASALRFCFGLSGVLVFLRFGVGCRHSAVDGWLLALGFWRLACGIVFFTLGLLRFVFGVDILALAFGDDLLLLVVSCFCVCQRLLPLGFSIELRRWAFVVGLLAGVGILG